MIHVDTKQLARFERVCHRIDVTPFIGPGADPNRALRQQHRKHGHRSARSTTGLLPCCSNRAASRSKVIRTLGSKRSIFKRDHTINKITARSLQPQPRLHHWAMDDHAAAGSLVSNRKIAANFLRQDVIDLSMPGNWLGTSSSRLMKNVVPPSMAQQNTTSLLQLSDQISALQATTSIPILRMPGRSSLENSR